MAVLPPSTMLAALLLLAALQPAQLATAPHHGCLLRSNSTAVNDSRGKSIGSVPQPTAEACAVQCSLNDKCDSFDYDGTNCHLKSQATVQPGPAASTAGWCPDEKMQQQWGKASITPAPAPYKCSSGEVCRFPFRLNGNLTWDCVERNGTPVCNTKDSRDLQSFDSTATFQPCTECVSCPQEGTFYQGFLLTNTAGNVIYYGVTSSKECQALCQLVTGCNFFRYHKGNEWCYLQYGVGRKYTNSGYSFGPKHCRTNSAGTTATTTTSTTKITTTTTLDAAPVPEMEVNFCCPEGEAATTRTEWGLFGPHMRLECAPPKNNRRSVLQEGLRVATVTQEGPEDSGVRSLKRLAVKSSNARGLTKSTVRIEKGITREVNLAVSPRDPAISLRGGSRPDEGNVFMHDMPVCDDNWGWEEAEVACRMLGYRTGTPTVKSHFGRAPSSVFGMDDVACTGRERSLTDCQHLTSDDCGVGEAAGVICHNNPHQRLPIPDITRSLPYAMLTAEGRLKTNKTDVEQEDFCLALDSNELVAFSWQSDPFDNGVFCALAKAISREVSRYHRPNQLTLSAFDIDGDSSIHFDELSSRLKELLAEVFNHLDKNNDGSLYDDAIKGGIFEAFSLQFFESSVNETFSVFDLNNDGHVNDLDSDTQISFSELIGRAPILLPGPLYLAYSRIDANKDEQLSLEEAINFVRRTFNIIDQNNDCQIDTSDVVDTLERLGLPWDYRLAVKLLLQRYLSIGSELAKAFIQRADTDSDGQVDMEEVVHFADFAFIEEMLGIASYLGYPHSSGYLVGEGRGYLVGEGRDPAGLETMYLAVLQELVQQPAYGAPVPGSCGG